MTPVEIFTFRYERLSELLKGGDSRQLLDVSKVLRDILIESPSIVVEVNRNYHYKIKFMVFQSSKEQSEKFAIPGAKESLFLVGTTLPPFMPLKELPLEYFLGFEIISYNNNHFTVHQVITACANKFGGVHYQRPEKDDTETRILRQIDEIINIAGAPAIFNLLIFVGGITIKALSDIYQAALQNTRTA